MLEIEWDYNNRGMIIWDQILIRSKKCGKEASK